MIVKKGKESKVQKKSVAVKVVAKKQVPTAKAEKAKVAIRPVKKPSVKPVAKIIAPMKAKTTPGKVPAKISSAAVSATAKVSSATGYGGPKKELIFAPAEVCFWVSNGPALQSLLDLRVAFKMLTEEQYSYHANKEKNDFASWVSAILKDEKCAKDLSKAKNMKAALKMVEKHLEGYAL